MKKLLPMVKQESEYILPSKVNIPWFSPKTPTRCFKVLSEVFLDQLNNTGQIKHDTAGASPFKAKN
jgi:hypothetical protein